MLTMLRQTSWTALTCPMFISEQGSKNVLSRDSGSLIPIIALNTNKLSYFCVLFELSIINNPVPYSVIDLSQYNRSRINTTNYYVISIFPYLILVASTTWFKPIWKLSWTHTSCFLHNIFWSILLKDKIMNY